MRQAAINIAAFIAHGFVTSAAGLSIETWTYWMLLALMAIVQLNSLIGE